MSAQTLLAKVGALGIALKADGNRLFYCPQEAVPPGLMAELQACKTEILYLLNSPIESCDPVRSEWLRPFLRKVIETPRGLGRLVATLPEFVVVDLQHPLRREVFLPGEVWLSTAKRKGGGQRR